MHHRDGKSLCGGWIAVVGMEGAAARLVAWCVHATSGSEKHVGGISVNGAVDEVLDAAGQEQDSVFGR